MKRPAFQSHFQRFEFKYRMPSWRAALIRDDLLSGHMKWDPAVEEAEEKSYPVTSLYLDSRRLKCFFENAAGLSSRFKIRVRGYAPTLEETERIFLEIKRKKNVTIYKDRVLLPPDALREFSVGVFDAARLAARWDDDREKAHAKTLEEIAGKVRFFGMTPMVVIRYRRVPLIERFNRKFRVTFDSNLEVARVEAGTAGRFHAFAPRLTVMEMKWTGSVPYWMHLIIKKYGLSRDKFSKYFYGVAHLKNKSLM